MANATTLPTAESIRRLAQERLGFGGYAQASSRRSPRPRPAETYWRCSLPAPASPPSTSRRPVEDGPDLGRLSPDRLGRRSADASPSRGVVGHRRELQAVGRGACGGADRIGRADEFVFVSPEQLTNAETRAALLRARPGFVRGRRGTSHQPMGPGLPARLPAARGPSRRAGASVRLALTATAAPPVRDEIVRRLQLRRPEIVIGDLDRPEIFLSVDHVCSPKEKQREIERAASELDGPGIVYSATHAGAQAVRDALDAAGHDVSLYLAGLRAAARRGAMEAFLDGSARIVSATVAFGMGIDKPDIRWVLHAEPPGSPDAYYQEIGRAGSGRQRGPGPTHLPPGRLPHGPIPAGEVCPARPWPRRRPARRYGGRRQRRIARDAGLATRSVTLALARLVDVGAASWVADGGVRWTESMSVADALEASADQAAREQEIRPQGLR